MTISIPNLADLPVVAEFPPLSMRRLDLPSGTPCFITYNSETGMYFTTYDAVDTSFDRLFQVNLFIRDLLDKLDKTQDYDKLTEWWHR